MARPTSPAPTFPASSSAASGSAAPAGARANPLQPTAPGIAFRPAGPADLPMLGTWLRTPDVARWWPDARNQIAAIEAHLSDPSLTLEIATCDGRPAGFVQHYAVSHWPAPHYATLPPGSRALDLFGAPDSPCRGSLWLGHLAARLLATAPAVAADPDPANARAIAAMARAGFRDGGLCADAQGRPLRLMIRLR